MSSFEEFDIMADRLDSLPRGSFVAMGEVMIRDTPADQERAERTRLVHLSPAGSEFTLAVGLSRLGIPASFVTRVPRNPYGLSVQNSARENGVATDHFVFAPPTEPIGRLIYELGRSPRRGGAVYQRMHSAASMLREGMVDWSSALSQARLFHVSGITFGLAGHSGYRENHNRSAVLEAYAAKPTDCLVGVDLNYRSTLWAPAEARAVMDPILGDHVDLLITTIEDIAQLYGQGIGGHSSAEVVRGDLGTIGSEELDRFCEEVIRRFDLRCVGVTIRYPDSFEVNRWESCARLSGGDFYRSSRVHSITLGDRLGGGDTWNAGFYYGLATEGTTSTGIAKGVVVGDAFTRLKQTAMFDLPIVDKLEIAALLAADARGGGKWTQR